ncbi:hypothetical protein C8Q79DRAFT_1004999 [Trametes meyenii]|nr:hypothetical protein C8Q79DRAFT_1004999 [Trametes meyenii]
MPPKRKSDVLAAPAPDLEDDEPAAVASESSVKRARKSDAGEGSSTGAKKGKAAEAPKNWRDVVLEGEEEGDLPIYDDCNDIRRKIRILQREPNFKITHWLKEIGNINNNSYQRFMKATGATGGASNGTYYAAYVYFEKVRIAEGKKKSAKRLRNEEGHSGGLPREDRKHAWVLTG